MTLSRCPLIPANILVLAYLLSSCTSNRNEEQLTYVGRDRCISCHEAEAALYHGSDHDRAMDLATDSTVLGDFSGVEATLHGVTSLFSKGDGKFFVTTEGEDGRMQEFEIRYVFGFHPLQQYLVEFGDGSVQCLPYAWDTRPAVEGGQRWFHVYGDQRIAPDDILFWTRASQRWNYMCAECHSTNLRKNYDPGTGTYRTSWSEIDVSCEACHGPGSLHVQKADGNEPDRRWGLGSGFPVRLGVTDGGIWEFNDVQPTARRTRRGEGNPEIALCARCHSRRSIISEEYAHGGPLEDTHYPSDLRTDLYYHDGQIRDEVYVYGSFLQSRMYREGVVCSDCHEPHSTRVYADGDALCFRCHKAEVFDHPDHHLHGNGDGDPECVDCHMPTTTYMVVDPRRDHSFRVPRPDLSRKIGSPEPCTVCHQDQSVEWAERELRKRFGIHSDRHFGETFAEARELNPGARKDLIDLFASDTAGSIVRATAVSLLSQYGSEDALSVTALALKDPDPSVRVSAISSLGIIPPNRRAQLLTPLLADSIRLVRTLAARGLAGVSSGVLSSDQEQQWRGALAEYESSQILNADHPSSLLNLANLYLEMGDENKAEEYLRSALANEPVFTPAYVNLADLYRIQGKEEEALDLLRKAFQVDPEDPVTNHALGLAYIRRHEADSAMVHLARSVRFGPEDPRNAYVYGVGLYSGGKPDEAIRVVGSALQRHPFDRNLLELGILLSRETGNQVTTLDFDSRLRALDMEDPMAGRD